MINNEFTDEMLEKIHPRIRATMKPVDFTDKLCQSCNEEATNLLYDFSEEETIERFFCDDCMTEAIKGE